jgi:hypothetical protein
MEEIELVGSYQNRSPFAISIASSGRELYDLRRAEAGSCDIRAARIKESAHAGTQASCDTVRESYSIGAPTVPGEESKDGKGDEGGEGDELLKSRDKLFLRPHRAARSTGSHPQRYQDAQA